MPHDPRAAIFDMVQAIERAERLARGLSEAGFASDEPVQWAVFSQIVILGEAAGRVDKLFQDDHVGALGEHHRYASSSGARVR